jgi:glycosyltransferase involved in cell wall biosynthesis
MKFSIILPVRNGGHYVKECVNSILSQSFKDFNLIVLDNCSTDGTIEWLASLNNDKIIIYPSLQPLSIEENWARATAVEKNEFITIIGHDDILNSDYLEEMNKLITQFPDAGLYQTHFNFIDGKGEKIRSCVPMQQLVKPVDFFDAVLQNSIEIIGTGFMLRSKEYDFYGGIPDYPNLLYADIEIWMKVIKGKYMAVSAANCFSFRFHIDNTSKSSGLFRLRAFERMVVFFKQLVTDEPAMAVPLKKNAYAFFKSYVVGSCHKLIYIPPNNRNGVTMDEIILTAEKCAKLLLPGIDFKPASFTTIRIAKMVDAVPVLRRGFLFYKSFFKRTF